MNTPIRRRRFLLGAGGFALALPRFEAFAASATPVKRMVCVGTTFGFVPKLFFPTTAGENYDITPLLKPLKKHRQDFTVISGLDHGVHAIGGHGGVHAFLSGILSSKAKSYASSNISVDQVAAQHVGAATRYPSLQLSMGNDVNNLLSWSSSGVALPPIEKPSEIFDVLFKNIDPKHANKLERLQAEKISLLDLVKTDAKRLEKHISHNDKEKLEQYFTSLRTLEKRMIQSKDWIHRPKPSVDYSLENGIDSAPLIERSPIYYDLIALALQTDQTRVISLEVSKLGKNNGGFDISGEYHQLTHHGKVESTIKELQKIERFQVQQFARFLDQLAEVKEPDGNSLLDNTITLLGSGMGNASSHSNRNLPLVLAGGGFKHGKHMQFKANANGLSRPACELFVSMLQRFGVETDQFNQANSRLTGLEFS